MIRQLFLFALLFLCCSPAELQAQVSYKCYSGQKAKSKVYWHIGLRTGISREFHTSHFDRELNSNYGWSQQLFVQRTFGQYFLLEFHTMHQSSNKDMLAYTYSQGRNYHSVMHHYQRLHNNIILHFLIPQMPDHLKLGAGIGLGLIASREQTDQTYTETGVLKEQSYATFTLRAPNVTIAVVAIYPVNKSWNINSQISFSRAVSDQIGHGNINIGLSYEL